jgi:hypothetical protein
MNIGSCAAFHGLPAFHAPHLPGRQNVRVNVEGGASLLNDVMASRSERQRFGSSRRARRT